MDWLPKRTLISLYGRAVPSGQRNFLFTSLLLVRFVQGLYPESHGIIASKFQFHDPQFKEQFNGENLYDNKWWFGEPVRYVNTLVVLLLCVFCFYVFSVFIAIMCLLMCVCRILIKITYLLTYFGWYIQCI